MKALTYQGKRDVRVENVPDPGLVEPDDIVLRVTSTAICGSDLHLFRGKVPAMKDGDILGHEFMGIVEDAGPEVSRVKKGDRVVIPFVIACGECFFCDLGLHASCETTNEGRGAILNKKQIPPGAALFGYSHLYGGIPGGQAEYVRVPKGNVGPLKVPAALRDEEALFLSDVLPTGYQAAVNAGITEGSSVVIYGAGPVGLMAAACARLLGAETIYIVDHHDHRLAFAEKLYGAIPMNFDELDDVAEAIIEQTDGRRGVDAAIDAVGFEAKGSKTESLLQALRLEPSVGKALRQCIATVRRGGTVSIPGVYAGFVHAFLIGDAFDKALTFKMGQTHVQRFLPELLELIEERRIAPHEIITHRMKLDEAAEAYRIFDEQADECRKIVLTA